MASHLGKYSTYGKVSAPFFWYSIYNDVANFVKSCEVRQKQGNLPLKSKNELHSIPIPTAAMKQVGVDLCNLPEVDEYRHLVVCVDYFSKLSEEKPIEDKTAAVSQFLYELMCRHGCFSVQINQGKDFVNHVSAELHRLTGIEQQVTSAYPSQVNGFVERQNRTIKNSLIKLLDSSSTQWPYRVEGVLFAHRVSKHSSTKCSPFKLVYNREPVLPVLPIDIKHNLDEPLDPDEPFNKGMFYAVLASEIRNEIHSETGENIKKAQKKQNSDYDRRHLTSNDINVGDAVLLKKRNDRKGWKFSFKWLGSYNVSDMTERVSNIGE